MALDEGSVVSLLANATRDMELRARQVAAGEVEPYPIDQDGYFTTLPREYYVSQEIFDEEVRKVFSRQWIYAGQTSQVPEPGDYYARQIGMESLIIARGQDGVLRAFFNVCRHRGSRICASEDAGNANHFVCPYHRWSYANDGHLLGAPGTRDGEDGIHYEDWGLQEARCGSYFGSIFVYLADEEPAHTLEESLEACTADVDKLAAIQPERTKIAARRVYDINANWKSMMENNAECYHCPGGHPSLCAALDVRATFVNPEGQINDAAVDTYLPFNDNAKTASVDGEWVCKKPLGGLWQEPQFSSGFVMFPNFCGMSYFADYGNVIVVEPVAIDRTRLICEWFVHEDAVEGEDYDVDTLIELWDKTNIEDKAFCEANFEGVKSQRFAPGPNVVRREGMMRGALVSYLEMMNVPDPVAPAQS